MDTRNLSTADGRISVNRFLCFEPKSLLKDSNVAEILSDNPGQILARSCASLEVLIHHK